MRPSYSILDPSFRYVSAAATSVAETWRRFGWRPTSATSVAETWRRFGWHPTTAEERKRRQGPAVTLVVDQAAAARSIGHAAPRALRESLASTGAA